MRHAVLTNVLQAPEYNRVQLHKNVWLGWDDGKVFHLDKQKPVADFYYNASQYLCLPGLVDAHVHLAQYHSRGRWEKGLLPWLEKHIFPAEAAFANDKLARKVSREFFAGLKKAGTTTAVVYTSLHQRACHIAFEEAEKAGLRIYMGKTHMDVHTPAFLSENTFISLQQAEELCRTWHKATPLLNYVFTPRFAPVCTPDLMRGVAALARRYGCLVQTHLSENQGELARVKALFPQYTSYTQVYDAHGLCDSNVLFAHCLHLSKTELDLIKQRGAKIVHCPDSNFFLKSGSFPWSSIKKAGIPFCLGSDVGAGTTLNMWHTARMAAYMQKGLHPTPTNLLHGLTRAAASVLDDPGIGLLNTGCHADFIMLPLQPEATADELAARLVFTGAELTPRTVVVAGHTVLGGLRPE